MIYNENVKKAINLAYDCHKGQFDKGGYPYILHPIHLAENMNTEDTTIVALLHDIVEDTKMTLSELSSMGFSDNIVEAIRILTKTGEKSYDDYIQDIKNNEIARLVKIADIKHNSDTTRLEYIDKEAEKRIEKYKRSLEILEN